MTFIGIICEHSKFDFLEKSVQKNMNKSDIKLININKKSIINLKNVKFDIIVIMKEIKDLDDSMKINELCKKIKYLIINSDIEMIGLSNIESNIITFGLNHRATVTFSSITDETKLVSVQRNFLNNNGKLIEVGEYEINTNNREDLHEMLVEFIIKKILL